MKARPILFSGAMVRALLAGTKTQTRRVIRDTGLYAINAEIHGPTTAERERAHLAARCPYGVPGDRLWVRETLRVVDCPFFDGPHYLYAEEAALYHQMSMEDYAAKRSWAHSQGEEFWQARSCGLRFGAVPSIHMPRWASRITLEVTAVRVERLQDISAGDIQAEGVLPPHYPNGTYVAQFDWEREAWRKAWDTINGKRAPWASNPWVWAITFKRAS